MIMDQSSIGFDDKNSRSVMNNDKPKKMYPINIVKFNEYC